MPWACPACSLAIRHSEHVLAAVQTTTFGRFGRCLMRPTKSRPSPSGNRTSITTRVGCRAATFSSASAPLLAASTIPEECQILDDHVPAVGMVIDDQDERSNAARTAVVFGRGAHVGIASTATRNAAPLGVVSPLFVQSR